MRGAGFVPASRSRHLGAMAEAGPVALDALQTAGTQPLCHTKGRDSGLLQPDDPDLSAYRAKVEQLARELEAARAEAADALQREASMRSQLQDLQKQPAGQAGPQSTDPGQHALRVSPEGSDSAATTEHAVPPPTAPHDEAKQALITALKRQVAALQAAKDTAEAQLTQQRSQAAEAQQRLLDQIDLLEQEKLAAETAWLSVREQLELEEAAGVRLRQVEADLAAQRQAAADAEAARSAAEARLQETEQRLQEAQRAAAAAGDKKPGGKQPRVSEQVKQERAVSEALRTQLSELEAILKHKEDEIQERAKSHEEKVKSLEQEAASARALQARLTALESEHTAQLQTSANLKRRVDGLLELVAEEQRQTETLTRELTQCRAKLTASEAEALKWQTEAKTQRKIKEWLEKKQGHSSTAANASPTQSGREHSPPLPATAPLPPEPFSQSLYGPVHVPAQAPAAPPVPSQPPPTTYPPPPPLPHQHTNGFTHQPATAANANADMAVVYTQTYIAAQQGGENSLGTGAPAARTGSGSVPMSQVAPPVPLLQPGSHNSDRPSLGDGSNGSGSGSKRPPVAPEAAAAPATKRVRAFGRSMGQRRTAGSQEHSGDANTPSNHHLTREQLLSNGLLMSQQSEGAAAGSDSVHPVTHSPVNGDMVGVEGQSADSSKGGGDWQGGCSAQDLLFALQNSLGYEAGMDTVAGLAGQDAQALLQQALQVAVPSVAADSDAAGMKCTVGDLMQGGTDNSALGDMLSKLLGSVCAAPANGGADDPPSAGDAACDAAVAAAQAAEAAEAAMATDAHEQLTALASNADKPDSAADVTMHVAEPAVLSNGEITPLYEPGSRVHEAQGGTVRPSATPQQPALSRVRHVPVLPLSALAAQLAAPAAAEQSAGTVQAAEQGAAGHNSPAAAAAAAAAASAEKQQQQPARTEPSPPHAAHTSTHHGTSHKAAVPIMDLLPDLPDLPDMSLHDPSAVLTSPRVLSTSGLVDASTRGMCELPSPPAVAAAQQPLPDASEPMELSESPTAVPRASVEPGEKGDKAGGSAGSAGGDIPWETMTRSERRKKSRELQAQALGLTLPQHLQTQPSAVPAPSPQAQAQAQAQAKARFVPLGPQTADKIPPLVPRVQASAQLIPSSVPIQPVSITGASTATQPSGTTPVAVPASTQDKPAAAAADPPPPPALPGPPPGPPPAAAMVSSVAVTAQATAAVPAAAAVPVAAAPAVIIAPIARVVAPAHTAAAATTAADAYAAYAQQLAQAQAQQAAYNTMQQTQSMQQTHAHSQSPYDAYDPLLHSTGVSSWTQQQQQTASAYNSAHAATAASYYAAYYAQAAQAAAAGYQATPAGYSGAGASAGYATQAAGYAPMHRIAPQAGAYEPMQRAIGPMMVGAPEPMMRAPQMAGGATEPMQRALPPPPPMPPLPAPEPMQRATSKAGEKGWPPAHTAQQQ